MTSFSRFQAVATAVAATLLTQGAFAQDECLTAVPIADGMTAFDTTMAIDEGVPFSCGGSGGAFDIWYVYTPSTSGPLTVSTCNAADFDTRLEVLDGCGGAVLGCNDDASGCGSNSSMLTVDVIGGADVFIRVAGWNGQQGTGTLTVDGPVFPDECLTAADITPGLPLAFDTTTATESGPDFSCMAGTGSLRSPDVWFTFTATDTYMATASTCDIASYDTKVEVYDGDCGMLNSVGCDDDGVGCAGFTSSADFMAVAGTQYWVRVGGWRAGDIGAGNLLISRPMPDVMNDFCTGAIALSNGVAEMFDTTLATPSIGVSAPSCGGSTSPLDIWYSVTPLVDSAVMVETCGSAFDTRLAAYEGACGSLVEVACNDDSCSLQSALSFPGTGGTTYLIRVGGFNANSGMGNVTATFLDMHPNDDCAGATPVGTGTTAFSTIGATDSLVDMSCVLNGESNDVWYSFTAGADCPVTVDLTGSSYDTGMAIYTGDCMTLVQVGCNDDGGVGLTSLISFDALAGTVYTIQIGGFGSNTGTGIMTITEGLGMVVCVGEVNSTGVGADLKITGSDVVADNNFILTVTNLPPNAMGYFVHSQETNLVLNPGGSQGHLCIASFTMGRFNANVLNSGAGGTVTFTPNLNALPGAMGPVAAVPGETRYFQFWTRDVPSTSNFSGATGVLLQ